MRHATRSTSSRPSALRIDVLGLLLAAAFLGRPLLPDASTPGNTTSAVPAGARTVGAGTASTVSGTTWLSVANAARLVPTLQATLTASVAGGIAEPGDTVAYTAVIANTSGEDALNVTYSVAEPLGAALLAGSMRITPLAFDDAYTDVVGNTAYAIGAPGLLANDIDPDAVGGPSATGLAVVTGAVTCTGIGGTFTPAADGSFSYVPPRGLTGTASCAYHVTDADGQQSRTTGLAVFTVSNMVWYVDDVAGSGGTGVSTNPFRTVAELNTAQTAGGSTNPEAGDVIYVLGGTYTGAGIDLLAGQSVYGQGVGLVSALGLSVDPAGSDLPDAGTAPTVSNTSGAYVVRANTTGTHRVQGLTLGSTLASGASLAGTGFGTIDVGTDVLSITNTAGAAIVLSTGTLAGEFLSVAASGTTSSAGGASFTGVASASAVDLGTGTLSGSAGGAALTVSGSTLSLTKTGDLSQTQNNALVRVAGGHSGSLMFSSGTLSATNGTGFQFDNADGTYAFSGTNTLSNSVGGADAGIDILNGSAGTFTFASTSSIANPANHVVRIESSAPTFTYAGAFSKTNAGPGILASSNTGGTLTFSGSGVTKTLSTSTGNAVSLTSNTGATINFTGGGLALTTTSGAAFNATGGGTVNLTGTVNTISSGTGTAVRIENTTIGSSGVTLQSVSANGGTNGIVLSSTGNTGGSFSVTGTGSGDCKTSAANCTGGTIQNMTGGDSETPVSGIGIYLNDTRRVSFTRMNLTGTSNHGLYGTGVRVALTLDNMRFAGTHGTSNSGLYDESAVSLVNAGGAIKVQNSRLDGGAYNAARVENTSGTAPVLDSLVFVDNVVESMQGSTADVRSTALLVNLMDGSAVVRMRNNNVRFWWGNAIHVLVQNTASATTRITGNTAYNTNGALAGAGGIWVAGGNHAYYIGNNDVRYTNGTAISADRAGTGSNMNGTIANNTVGASGIANSGTTTGIGIFASHHGSGTTTVLIQNNVLRQINGSASGAITTVTGDAAGFGGSGTMNATITGNNIQESGTTVNNAQHGILITHGVTSSAPGDSDQGCYNILNNTIINFVSGTANNRIRVNQRFSTTSRFPGYTGASTGVTSQTDLAAYLLSRNTASTSTNANTSTGGFLNTSPAGSACPQPTMTAAAMAGPRDPNASVDPALVASASLEALTLGLSAPVVRTASDVVTASVPDLHLPAASFVAPATPEVSAPSGVRLADVMTAASLTQSPVLPEAAPELAFASYLPEGSDVRIGGPYAPESFEGYAISEPAPTVATTAAPRFADVEAVIGTLPAGKEVAITYDLVVADVVPAGVSSLSQQATVAATGVSTTTDGDPGTAGEQPTLVPVSAAPDLAVALADSPDPVTPGGTLAYTASYVNNGTQGATGTELTITVPANTAFAADASTAGWTCAPDGTAGSTCTFAIGGVAGGGASGSVTFAVTVARPLPAGVTQISATATIADDGTNGTDLTPADDSGSATTALTAAPALTAPMTVALSTDEGSTGVANPRDVAVYTVTLTNDGTQDASDVVLTDTLPAGLTYVPNSVTIGGAAQTDGGPAVTYNAGTRALTVEAGTVAGSADGVTPGTTVVAFSATVDGPLVAGVTAIDNQAYVASANVDPPGTPALGEPFPTDGDAGTAGDQPTALALDPARLVVNEIDVNDNSGPDGADIAEFVEIRNVGIGDVDLANYELRIVTANGTATSDVALSGTLAAGGYYVVCTNKPGPAAPCDLDLPGDADLFPDDGPTAVAIVQTDYVVDAVSYGGTTPNGYSEGTGITTTDDGTGAVGFSRYDTGSATESLDTDANDADFVQSCATPRAANTDATTGCTLQLPVELVAFSAQSDGAGVRLTWTTASETDNAGFAIEARPAASTAWQEVAFVAGAGTSRETRTYSKQVEGLPLGAYRFRLRQVDIDGTATHTPEVEARVLLADAYRLSGTRPNPTRDRARFTLGVREAQQVRVEAFDATGRRVATLFSGTVEASREEEIVFEGAGLSSGVYVIRVTGERFAATRTVTLVR